MPVEYIYEEQPNKPIWMGLPPPSPSAKTNDGRYRVSTLRCYKLFSLFSYHHGSDATPSGWQQQPHHIRSFLPCPVLVYTTYVCVCTVFLKVVRTNDDEYGGEENPFTPHSLSPLTRGFYEEGERIQLKGPCLLLHTNRGNASWV